MSKQQITQLNDKTYIIDAFRGKQGFMLLTRVTKYVFPILKFWGNPDVEDETVVSELSSLLVGENASEVFDIIVELMDAVTVNGSKVNFDVEFEQNYDTLLKLTYEVLKLNYLESFQRLVTNAK